MNAKARIREKRLRELSVQAAACQNCPLYRNSTQTVFGEGPADAPVMIVGEVPGDQEDKQGRPFVGPAGRLLNRCLESLGIDRHHLYLTNAVKHFKWIPRGKRRLHQKPNSREINACHPWLEAELALIHPRLVVALGATAAQALMGKDFRVTKKRGRLFSPPFAEKFFATLHPSSLLRMPSDRREAEIRHWLRDLKKMKEFLR